jgi:hypothetical protein
MLIAIVFLTLGAFGAEIVDVGVALCFGRDGHRAVEGAAEHHSSVPSSGQGLTAHPEHGPCVDQTLFAHQNDPGDVGGAPPSVTSLVALAIDDAGPAVLRRDGRPLLPLSGFGSTLLRI